MFKLPSLVRPLFKDCSNAAKNSSRTVRAVSLDAMGTLIALDEPFNDVYSRVAADFGIHADPVAVAAAFPKHMKSFSLNYPCFGFASIGSFEWWKRVILGCLQEGCPTPIDQESGGKVARQLFDFYATAEAWRVVDPEIKNVVAQLRQNGVGVAVLSNFDERLKKILQDLDLYKLFDTVVLSGEIGIEKPNPKIFEVVLTYYHVSDPSKLLHIGDHIKKDYQAAKDFGAKAFLFDPLSVHKDVPSDDKLSSFSELKFT